MIERIFALPRSRRVFLYGGASALLLFLHASLVYVPRSLQIAEAQERARSLEEARAKLRSSKQDFDKAGAEVQEAERQFEQTQLRFPEQKEIPELLRQVSNLGRESGLNIVLFRQKPEVLHSLYAEVPVEMAVRGSYYQITSFFEKVHLLDRIVGITDTSMKNAEMVEGGMRIDATFSATTYRLLTAEELGRLVKEKEEKAKKRGKNKKEVS